MHNKLIILHRPNKTASDILDLQVDGFIWPSWASFAVAFSPIDACSQIYGRRGYPGSYIRHNVYGPMIDLSTDVISQLKEGGRASFKFLAKPPKAYVCAIQ